MTSQDDRLYRNYTETTPQHVRDFYSDNHRFQTVEFVNAQREKYLNHSHAQMGIWEALELLNTVIDESDPDTELSQIKHCLQTSEAIRAKGYPRWFILAGLIHDLGKILCLRNESQWAVTGDTFPVGCPFSDKIVFPEFFEANPDLKNPKYQSEFGIYHAGIGLNKVIMSWGHDEYCYQVVKNYLPDPALAIIRYHSFYAWHQDNAYHTLMDDHDRKMLPSVQAFQPFDLYTKHDLPPNVEQLQPFYEKLIAEFFPAQIDW
jgi:inositol oxygenase